MYVFGVIWLAHKTRFVHKNVCHILRLGERLSKLPRKFCSENRNAISFRKQVALALFFSFPFCGDLAKNPLERYRIMAEVWMIDGAISREGFAELWICRNCRFTLTFSSLPFPLHPKIWLRHSPRFGAGILARSSTGNLNNLFLLPLSSHLRRTLKVICKLKNKLYGRVMKR